MDEDAATSADLLVEYALAMVNSGSSAKEVRDELAFLLEAEGAGGSSSEPGIAIESLMVASF